MAFINSSPVEQENHQPAKDNHLNGHALAFESDVREAVKNGASPYETINQNQASPEELTIHHLIPQWFAKEYLDLDYLLNPQAFNFKDRFMSFFLGRPLKPLSALDWLKTKYNAILIDSDSHQEIHNYDFQHQLEAMLVYRGLTIFFLGQDAFLADRWQDDFDHLKNQQHSRDTSDHYEKSAGHLRRTIPYRLDSLRNFEPLHKTPTASLAQHRDRKSRDRAVRQLNQKLRRFVTELQAEKRA